MSAPDTDNASRSFEILSTAILAVLLIAAWLLWSGLYKPLLIGLGVFSCVVTIAVARRMNYFNRDLFALRYGVGVLFYWAWLVKEIFFSSIDVSRIVLRRRLDVAPVIVKVDAQEMSHVDQVVFGNSITLTPGTLTLDIHEDKITVHALTRAGAESLKQGNMQRRVRALRGI